MTAIHMVNQEIDMTSSNVHLNSNTQGHKIMGIAGTYLYYSLQKMIDTKVLGFYLLFSID